MRLHPCGCGNAAFAWSRHQTELWEDTLVSVYHGTCGRCGVDRRFEFEVSGERPTTMGYGDDMPSRIIDPGEFLTEGLRAAATVPVDPKGLSEPALRAAYAAIDTAVAAVEEVLKFIPPGADAVPATTFSSEAGQRAYSQSPGQFERAHLTGVLAHLREVRSGYAAPSRT